MDNVLVGCGQLTWKWVSERQVLAEIAQAGYDGAPVGYRAGQSSTETITKFAEHGLKPAPGYLGANLWEKGQADSIVDQAQKLARFLREVGCGEVHVAANLTGGRRKVSGHVKPAEALSAAELAQMADTLNRVGEATLKEGVRTCFHNHVGSYVETRDEIDRLFASVDRSLVFQGPDLGHLAWAGDDVVQFCRDYADSIKTLHIKDIDPRIREEGRESGWDYGTFSNRGIFVEIGEGLIDYPAVFDVLRQASYAGWVIVETDVTRKSSALESATISRRYLKGIGV